MTAGNGIVLRVKDLERFGEPLKFLPVGFVGTLVAMLYSIYMRFHAWPKLNLGSWWCAAVFNALTSMLLLCYARCILVSPGTVPDSENDPSWTCQPRRGGTHAEQFEVSGASLMMQEAKRTGDKRNCKWCAKYKPDRCHHCRVCRTCVLKMDHHCPWIYNCVGFGNHKYFFLLLVYTVATCWFIALSMMGTVRSSVDSRTYFLTMFSLLFGQTLSVFLACVASAFLGFHIWLMFRGMTTIEFCEKSMRRAGYDGSLYDRGAWGNVCAVLGNNCWLWLLPVNPPSGTGLEFSAEETPLLLTGASLKASKAFEDGKLIEPVSPPRPRHSANVGSAGTGSAPTSDAEGS